MVENLILVEETTESDNHILASNTRREKTGEGDLQSMSLEQVWIGQKRLLVLTLATGGIYKSIS